MLLQITETKLQDKIRILVVEDDPIVQKVHCLTLEKLGYVVKLAENGTEALKMFKDGYNLIVLDCGLPDISGIEVGKIIRQYEQQHNLVRVPIVMVTGFVLDANLQQERYDAGIDDLINKPIYKMDQWGTLLDRWLIKN